MVRDAGGRLDIGNGLNAHMEGTDPDVDIKKEGALLAWVSSQTDEGKEVDSYSLSVTSREVFRAMGDIAKIAAFFDIEVQGVEAVRVEVPVKDEREVETARDALKREVDAHERTRSEKRGADAAFKSAVGILAENLKN